VYWPVLRDNVTEGKVPVEATLADVARHAALLGRPAREAEGRADQRRGADD
jgi:hypothetical protein